MEIHFYKNLSEKNKVSKTLGAELLVEGNLREGCSITAPSILIESEVDTVFNRNYAYIPDFNRYYFIDNITSENTHLWRIDMSVDVLMSYKTEILNTNAFIRRNENLYNINIEDKEASYVYTKTVNVYQPTMTAGTSLTSFTPATAPSYYVISYSGAPYKLYSATDEDIITGRDTVFVPSVNSKSAGVQPQDKIALIDPDNLFILNNYFITNSDKVSFLKSVIALPFSITPSGEDETDLYMGTNRVTFKALETTYSAEVRTINHVISPRYLIADFTIAKGLDYLNYEPYTQYEIYIPYKGWISLPADEILNKRIQVYYMVNYYTGEGTINVMTYGGTMLYQSNCQLGVSLGFTTDNIRNISGSIQSDVLNGILQSVSSAISQNPVAIASTAVSQVRNLTNFNDYRVKGNCDVQSGYMGLYGTQAVLVRETTVSPVTDYRSAEYKAKYGLPLYGNYDLKDLTGFTVCDDFHLELFLTATSTELTTIENLLKGGIIL